MYRRLASRLCCAAVRSELPDLFLPYGQVGVGVKGGLEASIHALRFHIKEHGDKEDLCLLKIDMQNAFNECDRFTFLHRVKQHFPDVFGWVQWCYHTSAELRFGCHRLLSSTGVQQGDPLGPLLFSLVVLELMDSIDPPQELLLQLWYLDDGSFVGPRTAISDLLTQISKNGPKFGLHLNMKKCEVFWPSGDQFFSEFPEEVCRVRDEQGGVELLGSPVWGTSDFIKSFVATQVGRILELQSCLGDLEDPQVELHLLRSCLSTGKIRHLLRTVPPGSADEHFRHFDEGLRSTLSQILRCTISDLAWLQATLPFRLGGLGLRESLRTAPIAFLASCRNTYLLVARLLHRDTNPIFHLPGEMDNLEYLKQLLPNFDPLPGDIAQRSVQVASDRVLWAQLLDSSNLRDAARLNTQSGGKHTYAWLQAIPHPNLGLSMSSSEFFIALRYWLGIPLFRGSHLQSCTCRSPLDQHGDHLLGCGQGPLRIRRHDALCNIVYHALSQDNSSVRREERIWGESRDRPGDIFHPDFDDGHPTYFDISVRHMLQPGNLNRASTNAGAAAIAGEMEKDQKHAANVERIGGRFHPLVMETLGVWTASSLSTLHAIAARTTVRNGLTVKQATSNLLQQLSVKCWSYNAKMLLQYLSLSPGDNPLWDAPL